LRSDLRPSTITIWWSHRGRIKTQILSRELGYALNTFFFFLFSFGEELFGYSVIYRL
jgi:hypothetical protein